LFAALWHAAHRSPVENHEKTDELAAALKRIEESATYCEHAQFEQAKFWRGMNLLLGIPASVLAAVAGATALASTGGRIAAGIVALVSAGLSAVTTTLHSSEWMDRAESAGNQYLALKSDARIARRVDLPGDAATGRRALDELRARQDEINAAAAPPSFYANWRAMRTINSGQHLSVLDADRPAT
jgi:hypothetical protein